MRGRESMSAMAAAFICGGVYCRGTVPNAAACGPCGCHRCKRVSMIDRRPRCFTFHRAEIKSSCSCGSKNGSSSTTALLTCTWARILLQEPRPRPEE